MRSWSPDLGRDLLDKWRSYETNFQVCVLYFFFNSRFKDVFFLNDLDNSIFVFFQAHVKIQWNSSALKFTYGRWYLNFFSLRRGLQELSQRKFDVDLFERARDDTNLAWVLPLSVSQSAEVGVANIHPLQNFWSQSISIKLRYYMF